MSAFLHRHGEGIASPPSATRVRPRAALGLLLLAALVLLLAPIARANVVGQYEAPYTKGTTNTWHFTWTDPGGAYYYIQYTLYKDNQQVLQENTGYLSGGNGAAGNGSGDSWDQQANLQSGHVYDMCASEYYTVPGSGLPDEPHAFDCKATTIDNSNPVVASYTLDGTLTYTNSPVMHLDFTYSDSISPPWPANFIRIQGRRGGQPYDSGTNYSQGCSSPSSSPRFLCDWDVSQLAGGGLEDGNVTFCVTLADSAFPDGGTSIANESQSAQAYANHANLSAPSCATMVLDRGAPTVRASSSSAAPHTGDLVSFSASASDSLSGVSGAYDWDFGDNTAHGSGATPTHTYTQPGTYHVTVTTHDGAGNAGSASLTETVTSPAGGGNATPTGGGNTTPTGGSAGQTGTTTSGTGTSSGSGGAPTGSGANSGVSAAFASLALATSQVGPILSGQLTILQAGSTVEVDAYAPAAQASAKRKSKKRPVLLARLVQGATPPGLLKFKVPLNAQGKRALKRHHRLLLSVIITVTPPRGAAQVISRQVSLRAP